MILLVWCAENRISLHTFNALFVRYFIFLSVLLMIMTHTMMYESGINDIITVVNIVWYFFCIWCYDNMIEEVRTGCYLFNRIHFIPYKYSGQLLDSTNVITSTYTLFKVRIRWLIDGKDHYEGEKKMLCSLIHTKHPQDKQNINENIYCLNVRNVTLNMKSKLYGKW